jgi:hypothetical protein
MSRVLRFAIVYVLFPLWRFWSSEKLYLVGWLSALL